MRLLGLALRSASHYRRRELLVALASAVCTAVLAGALVVGDSVRGSLRAAAERRLGGVRFALEAGERLVTQKLAERLAASLGTTVAPALRLRGSVSAGSLALSGVEIAGIGAGFWELFPGAAGQPPAAGEIILAAPLAARLDAKEGSEVLVRLQKPLAMPRSLTLAPEEAAGATLRLVARVAPDRDPATRFDLRSGQEPPLLALVSLEGLAVALDAPGRANTLLVTERSGGLGAAELEEALRQCLEPGDLGLALEAGRGPGAWSLRSERVYIDDPVMASARASGLQITGSLAYFALALELSGRTSSYAFVASSAELDARLGLGAGEVVLTSWVAEELGTRPGDRLTLTYYAPDAALELEERSTDLRVSGIVPTATASAEADLIPRFPGFADAASCREWSPGIPIDLSRIRARDEEYWREFGMAPKAFVSLATAQELWRSRYGGLTSLAIRGWDGSREELARRLLGGFRPESAGLSFRDARSEAVSASSGSVDFGELFLALSFFILASALLLTGMLFGVSVTERERETGILAAVGFGASRIRLLYLVEGLSIALVGAVAGAPLGVGYAGGLLAGLRTLWRGAVGSLELGLVVRGGTLALAAAAGILASLFALAVASRTALREPAALLARSRLAAPRRRGRRALWLVEIGSAAGALAAAILGARGGLSLIVAFAAAGSLCLAFVVAGAGLIFSAASSRRSPRTPTLLVAGFRNLGRRLGRNMVALLAVAAGVFAVVAVGWNRVGIGDPWDRGSGTGGFALVAEASAPVPSGRLQGPGAPAFIVGLQVRDGEDASCLNLSRVERPRVLGLSPSALSERGAFRFAGVLAGIDDRAPWLALEAKLGDGEIPAIVDATVLTWGLRRSLGDSLSYVDDFGRPVRLRLVGALESSVFQGSVLISSAAFLEHFPDSAGARFLLVEADAARAEETASELRRLLRPYGTSVEGAAERLASYTVVQNTYLSVFLLLGALGVLLGSVCLGLVVARNVRESRAELALLEAVGFAPGRALGVVLAEQLPLVATGVIAGLFSATIAVYPVVSARLPGSHGTFVALADLGGRLVVVVGLCVGVLLVGVGSALAAAWGTLRAGTVSSLRAE